jgi:hypothetical protein
LHSRFKPGQSGNPKGRPKQSQNLRTIVKQVSNEQIQIREGDRPRRMSRIEALVRTTYTRAFKDPKALASLIILLRQCGYGADHDEPADHVLLGRATLATSKWSMASIAADDALILPQRANPPGWNFRE